MDLNTILIILGAIAVVILVIHGIWLNHQNKSKVFDNEDPMQSNAEPVDLPTDVSNETEAKEGESVSEMDAKTETKSSVANHRRSEKKGQLQDSNTDIEQKVDESELNADLSHITISLRDKEVCNLTRDDLNKTLKDGNENNDIHSSALREQIVQAKKKEKTAATKDIEMPAMPKDSVGTDILTTSAVSVSSDPVEEHVSEKGIDKAENMEQSKIEKHIDVDLPEVITSDDTSINDEPTKEENVVEEPQINSNVIMLYVVAPEHRCFKGSDLQQALDKEGFLFGAQSIYHRHSEFNCHSPVLFSLANLEGPGEFDPENMDSMRTFGVAIFMETPVKYGSARTNLRFMINSAKALAKDLNGYLLSDKQEPFTFDVEQEYLSRVF